VISLNHSSSCDGGNNKSRRNFEYLIASNYLVDFGNFLQETQPDILEFKRVVIFYGGAVDEDRGMKTWRRLLAERNRRDNIDRIVEFIPLIPSDPPRSKTNPLGLKIPFGVHHTKMFLMGYEDRSHKISGKHYIRVVVHTANLLPGDTNFKVQGVYAQDFPLKGANAAPLFTNPYKRNRSDEQTKENKTTCRGWPFEDDNPLPFEDDLVTYLESYRYLTKQSWFYAFGNDPDSPSSEPISLTQLVRKYDYSKAWAVLIPSVPGRHVVTCDDFGYVKLRKTIIEKVCKHHDAEISSKRAPVLCQFSSIGSLSSKWLQKFASAVDSSCTHTTDLVNNCFPEKDQPPLASRLRIIWPTSEEIRNSIEGYRGGGSMPGTMKNIAKDFLVPLYHRWTTRSQSNFNGGDDPLKTARYVPHIKTFVQPAYGKASMEPLIEWILITSHNLSKAAWGEIQNCSTGRSAGNKVLFIRHWELGVFFSPATLRNYFDRSDEDVDDGHICIVPYTGKNGPKLNNSRHVVEVPLPFDLHPCPYSDSDTPWSVDGENSTPDSFGRIGCY